MKITAVNSANSAYRNRIKSNSIKHNSYTSTAIGSNTQSFGMGKEKLSPGVKAAIAVIAATLATAIPATKNKKNTNNTTNTYSYASTTSNNLKTGDRNTRYTNLRNKQAELTSRIQCLEYNIFQAELAVSNNRSQVYRNTNNINYLEMHVGNMYDNLDSMESNDYSDTYTSRMMNNNLIKEQKGNINDTYNKMAEKGYEICQLEASISYLESYINMNKISLQQARIELAEVNNELSKLR